MVESVKNSVIFFSYDSRKAKNVNNIHWLRWRKPSHEVLLCDTNELSTSLSSISYITYQIQTITYTMIFIVRTLMWWIDYEYNMYLYMLFIIKHESWSSIIFEILVIIIVFCHQFRKYSHNWTYVFIMYIYEDIVKLQLQWHNLMSVKILLHYRLCLHGNTKCQEAWFKMYQNEILQYYLTIIIGRNGILSDFFNQMFLLKLKFFSSIVT